MDGRIGFVNGIRSRATGQTGAGVGLPKPSGNVPVASKPRDVGERVFAAAAEQLEAESGAGVTGVDGGAGLSSAARDGFVCAPRPMVGVTTTLGG
jgi:hypothetical protein